jgi:hypothetical protein
VELSSVAVPAIQRPRYEGRRGPQLLGCTAALLAALVCASVFVATAQAEDLPPPASNGAALSSEVSGEAADAGSMAIATATGATDTAPDATDTSGTTTDAADPTTDATDPSTDTIDTSGTATDAIDPSTDTTDTSGTATDATDPTTDTTDTTDTAREASGAAPLDPSGGSDARASDSDKRRGKRGGSDAASGTDSVPPPSAFALADGVSQLPSDSASSSEGVGGSSSDFSTSSSATPEVRSEPTFGATSRGEGPTTDSRLGDLSRSGAGGAGDEVTVVPASCVPLETGAVGLIRWRADHRFIVVCRSAILARAHSDSERGLLAQWPAPVQAMHAGQARVRTGGESGRPDGSQRPRSHRPPAPDDEPPVPMAPSSGLGSGSSGGLLSGAVLGVITALFSLTPPRNGRLVRLVERRRRPLHLFFFLERPG